ncbi:hypothetical protein ACFY4C_25805 [Actinomadura viridis]|uniref:hypothetical protein n=1 Tax=Actinomadura viridis TaxID=58110 RepID=UPI00367C8257
MRDLFDDLCLLIASRADRSPGLVGTVIPANEVRRSDRAFPDTGAVIRKCAGDMRTSDGLLAERPIP